MPDVPSQLNDYYWGDVFGFQGGRRREVLRPLSRDISTRIPQEVVDHIIDQLAGCSAHLYNCALVCRSWNYRSTEILFTRIIIRSPRHFDNLAHAALQEERVRQHLAGTQHFSIEDRSGDSRSHLVVYLYALTMRSLRTLAFSQCTWTPIHPSFTLLLSQFATVTHVSLDKVHVQNFTDLRRIICAFPRLEHLVMKRCSLKHHTPVHASHGVTSKSLLPHLNYLELGENDVQLLTSLAQWLRIPSRAPSLRELSLSEHLQSTGFDLDALEHILRFVGYKLSSLAVEYPYINGMHRHLCYVPALHTLSFPLSTLSTRYPSRNLATELESILLSVSSADLESLTLVEAYTRSSHREMATARVSSREEVVEDVQPLDHVTKDARFVRLKKAKIVLRALNHDTEEEVESIVRSLRHLLSYWDERNILLIE
ncbi:uncharacterized protein C8Q71DRAFT_909452 [Rhodofomes roseus]|uniref:F-box domain-containing protein n=1 Tax=Rhodofomes roseus TaxID=34475 RepID=A0ABQ8K7Y1_9APHY|nr:uncharacterized protein C8Q71DRAFT_909452 [Rhodofomes roseus]KAH9833402.1 hypothetical protein C8Q71DRAFT_909452 [Rhodofomes roseus]